MSIRSCIVFCVAILILCGCASNSTKQTKKIIQKTTEKQTAPEQNSAYFLNQARQAKDVYQRNGYLIQTAESFQAEQQCVKSIKMLEVLKPEIEDNRQQAQLNLTLAECYLVLSDDGLGKAEQIVSKLDNDYGYQARLSAVLAQIYVLKKQWLNAANALQATNIEESQKTQETWQWVKQLNLAELEKARLSEEKLQAWLQLAIITKRYALQPELFSQQLVSWQSRHLGHPLVTALPDDIQVMLAQPPIQAQRITILLPLTGRLANQGLAVKEGVLAAYLENLANPTNRTNQSTPSEIEFIDSALKTAEELNTLVADFDVVIGPLVKEKISELSQILPADKILLALNRVNLANNQPSLTPIGQQNESEALDKEHYYFALAPEDEGEQIAQYMQRQQLVRPVVFAANNDTAQRMAEAFINQWQQAPNSIKPDLSTFTDSKDMRARVSDILDVSQSKARINQIENIADVEVIGVERNRRDIDAMVLFANPEQTALLNPIIEASLSPFARKTLAVFASSRSYSLDLNSNNLRDLRNLTFTDMPWMLPEHNWQSLAEEINQVWAYKQDTLMRLFAMGFDAYNLLPNLRRLKALPQLASQGLTGEIFVDSNGVVHRRLPWAQIAHDRVQLLAMDQ